METNTQEAPRVGAKLPSTWRCCAQFDVVLEIDRRNRHAGVGNITVNDAGTVDEWLSWGLMGAGDYLTEAEVDQAEGLNWTVRFCPFCGVKKPEK